MNGARPRSSGWPGSRTPPPLLPSLRPSSRPTPTRTPSGRNVPPAPAAAPAPASSWPKAPTAPGPGPSSSWSSRPGTSTSSGWTSKLPRDTSSASSYAPSSGASGSPRGSSRARWSGPGPWRSRASNAYGSMCTTRMSGPRASTGSSGSSGREDRAGAYRAAGHARGRDGVPPPVARTDPARSPQPAVRTRPLRRQRLRPAGPGLFGRAEQDQGREAQVLAGRQEFGQPGQRRHRGHVVQDQRHWWVEPTVR